MRILIGTGLLALAILSIFLLRPKNGQERPIVRFPGAWIVVGLLLTGSVASGAALIIVTSVGW